MLAYDIFYSARNKCVCLIAPGDPSIGFEGIECEFGGRITVPGRILSGRDDEDCYVRTTIVLFVIPGTLDSENEFEVTVRAGDRVFYEAVRIRTSDAERVPVARLAAVLLFKDEQPFLAQWLDYHILLGVEHFYLYDNNSEDRAAVLEILRPYLEKGLVTHIPWDFPYKYAELSATFTQAGAVNHWLYRFGHRSEWMTHIDVDEYVYPLSARANGLRALLEAHENEQSVGSLVLRWCWFGNSGFRRMPPGRVIENFIWRQHLDYDGPPKRNQNKLLIRSNAVEILNYHYVTLHKAGCRGGCVDPARIRLNHYAAITYRGRIKKRRHNDVRDCGMLPLAAELNARHPSPEGRGITSFERSMAEARRFVDFYLEKALSIARRTRSLFRR